MSGSAARSYATAKQAYAALGVDADKAVKTLSKISISMHCWQGDDVGGFESRGGLSDSGTMATGNYPGKARNADELRQDAEMAMSLIPGKHRFNLHAIYAETNGKKVDRDELEPRHFSRWIDWAKHKKIGLDFNPTFFSHPKAASGFTLAGNNESERRFWVRHGIACRQIAAAMGRQLGTPCVNNTWIPDGYKDVPACQKRPREILEKSLDEMYSVKIPKQHCLDAVEGKLFGIATESYVVGSFEFYLGYALTRDVLLCLDMGHFHPTETIGGKISSLLMNMDSLLLHVSRGVRWDSDHVPLFSDDIRELGLEIIRCNALSRVKIATDFFDASINRVAAWVIGVRSMQKALLYGLLEPSATLRALEQAGDYTSRLALHEETKMLPFGLVWDYFCEKSGVPVGFKWMDAVKSYEKKVLAAR